MRTPQLARRAPHSLISNKEKLTTRSRIFRARGAASNTKAKRPVARFCTTTPHIIRPRLQRQLLRYAIDFPRERKSSSYFIPIFTLVQNHSSTNLLSPYLL